MKGNVIKLALAILPLVLLTDASPVIATTISFTDADKIGEKVYAKWLQDTQSVGEFFLFHFGPVMSVDANDPLTKHTFTSPKKFWEVQLSSVSQQGIPEDFFISYKGTMQHITKADNQDLADKGAKFEFNLGLLAKLGVISDSQKGTTNHPPHEDFFEGILGGVVGLDDEILSFYSLSLAGSHPPGNIFFHPDDAVLTPEPGSLPLLVTGLLGFVLAVKAVGKRKGGRAGAARRRKKMTGSSLAS